MNSEKMTQSRLLTCVVAGQWLAVPVDQLSEVVTPQLRTKVPLSTPSVNGLINLRGKILTELDMLKILNLPDREDESRYRTIIIEGDEGENFGLTVDSVGEVIDIEPDAFERTPDSLDPKWKSVCHGVLKQDKRILVMLDIEKVITLSLS